MDIFTPLRMHAEKEAACKWQVEKLVPVKSTLVNAQFPKSCPAKFIFVKKQLEN